ncbi:MAG: pantothenate kinase [Stenomitos rutilans HA7619-LM2]|jgi:type III pantothenate kinase|nr:pantothenate kinase [Stenomitos rutilans HA7619-LM2]
MEQFDTPKAKLLVDRWFALSIGNSRLHWATFIGNDLHRTWNTPHLSIAEVQAIIETQLTQNPDLYIASVVPAQCQYWERYPFAHVITLKQVPLKGLYPTLGIDRALAVWGAIDTVGCPVLVIDAGTALTFTGADGTQQLVGGAILPGLGLQFQFLHQATAALPDLGDRLTEQHHLPPRWALNTTDAIASGILYTFLAGLRDFVTAWWQQFPNSPVLLRGGDSERLYAYLTAYDPALASRVTIEPELIFWGLRSLREWGAASRE